MNNTFENDEQNTTLCCLFVYINALTDRGSISPHVMHSQIAPRSAAAFLKAQAVHSQIAPRSVSRGLRPMEYQEGGSLRMRALDAASLLVFRTA